jgi:hypothetical protein
MLARCRPRWNLDGRKTLFCRGVRIPYGLFRAARLCDTRMAALPKASALVRCVGSAGTIDRLGGGNVVAQFAGSRARWQLCLPNASNSKRLGHEWAPRYVA